MKIRPYSRIVVEGMDGSGKTTLVNQLVEYLGDRADLVPGYNRTPDPKSPMPQWWMEQLARNPVNRITIHDRFFYPELVYGPVLRGRMIMDYPTRVYVQNFLRNHAILIYCRPPVEVIERGARVENQMQGVLDNFNELLVTYDRVMIGEGSSFLGRFIKYNWTDDIAFKKLLQRVTGYIYE